MDPDDWELGILLLQPLKYSFTDVYHIHHFEFIPVIKNSLDIVALAAIMNPIILNEKHFLIKLNLM